MVYFGIMKKQEQIEAKKNKPIEVGDLVKVSTNYFKTVTETVKVGRKREFINKEVEKKFTFEGTVLKIENDKYYVKLNSTSVPYELNEKLPSKHTDKNEQYCIADISIITPTVYECGANPFCKEKRRISFYNQDIWQILFKAGYGKITDDYSKLESTEDFGNVNFNPFIIDANGNRQYYQRDLVWTLEQKQLLIDSIYQNIEIGKFLFRYNSWERMQLEKKETGVGHGWDCVDGKQRFFAIVEFLQNKFQDNYGNYWKDLSANAQRRFLNFPNLSYGELPETASDEDVIDNFLTLNFTGTPMSRDHIEYVKSFNMK